MKWPQTFACPLIYERVSDASSNAGTVAAVASTCVQQSSGTVGLKIITVLLHVSSMMTLKVIRLLAVVREETTALVALTVTRLLVALINVGSSALTEIVLVELSSDIPNLVKSPAVAGVSE
jgi:hypothetical protein